MNINAEKLIKKKLLFKMSENKYISFWKRFLSCFLFYYYFILPYR